MSFQVDSWGKYIGVYGYRQQEKATVKCNGGAYLEGPLCLIA